MEHLAIDLGGRESQICVRSSDGQIVEERRCRTGALAGVSGGPSGRRAAWSSRPAAKRLGSPMRPCASGTRCASSRRRWCGPWASARAG